jgi:Tol biopolymer transport system component
VKPYHELRVAPHWPWAILLLAALAIMPLLAACGGPTPTPQVLVVTATFTPGSQAQVVTATFTPSSQVAAADTVVPSPPAESTTGPGQAAIQAPTVTLAPLGPTETAQPTETTPPQDTETPTAQPTVETPVTQPTAKPPSLATYFVVYTAYKGPDLQDYGLWGMNGDGSEAFRIEGAGQASEPAFSADGSKFAFYHWTDGLYIWDLNKKTSFQFVQDGNASFPTWAPNGQRLAYFVAAGQRWIYIVNADGSGSFQLTPGLRPNWSLQGGFIAYDTCENNRCGIFRINPDGGGKRQLTSDGGGGAAVSPNGKRIAYWSQADGDFEVYLVNADGSGQQQLTQNKGNDALPAWSPDGKYVYYLSDQSGKGWAVMVMNADGSNPRKVINTSAGSDPVRGWQYQRITVTWNR